MASPAGARFITSHTAAVSSSPTTGNGARLDLYRIASLIEEGPDVAGLVFIIEIGCDVHAVYINPPLARSRLQRTGNYVAQH
jgi:hypothetical protein